MKINQLIRELSQQIKHKIVVAIEGYSGSGKTTLLKKLARENSAIVPVYIDDFMNTGRKRRLLLKAAKDKTKVMELEWNNTRKLRQLINAYRKNDNKCPIKVYNPKTDRYDRKMIFDLTQKIMVIEGIFLFHPKLYQDLFDYKVYLDIDPKVADARRVRREKKRWGKKYVPEDRPDSFVRLFKMAYQKYSKHYKIKKAADYIVNANGYAVIKTAIP